MNKIIVAFAVIFFILPVVIGQECTENCPLADDPTTWTEGNVQYLTGEELAAHPEEAKTVWNSISRDEQAEIFKQDFNSFRDRANDFFTNYFRLPVSNLDNVENVLFDGAALRISVDGIEQDRQPYLSKDALPSNVIGVEATADGFTLLYEGNNQISLHSGTINADGTLSDGSRLLFTGTDGVANVMPDGIYLSHDATLTDANGNLIIARENGLVIKRINGQVSLIGSARGTFALADGKTIAFETNRKFVFDMDNFEAEDGTVSISQNGNELQRIQGTFQRNGDVTVLRGAFDDFTTGTIVTGTVAVAPRGTTIPEEYASSVTYDENYVSTRGLVDVQQYDLHIKSNSQTAEVHVQNGNINAVGVVSIENDQLHYNGLLETTSFTSLETEDGITVSIHGQQDGEMARVMRKVRVGSLIKEDSFSEEYGITTVIARENGVEKLGIIQQNLGELAKVERDPNLFALFDNSMTIQAGDATLAMSPEFGIHYERKDRTVDILSSTTTHQYLGNDLATIKSIVPTLEDFKTKVNSLNKIYDVGAHGGFSAESLDETRALIREHLQGREQEAALASITINALIDLRSQHETPEDNAYFKTELEKVSQGFQSGEVGAFFESGNLAIPRSQEEAFRTQLINRIQYEQLTGASDQQAVIHEIRGSSDPL